MSEPKTCGFMSEPWRVTLLGGGPRAERASDRAEITRFYTQKYAALMAYLSFYRDRQHAREVLVAMLWPYSPRRQGLNSLSVALSSLRHQLEPPGTPAGGVLLADRFNVGLNPAALTTDVSEFEEALRAVEAAAAASKNGGSNNGGGGGRGRAEVRERLARVLELYRGPLLPGHYEPWIAPEQERLAGRFVDAAGALITLLEAEGDLSAALAVARRAVAADPLREEGQHHLIRLLAASGQDGAALRQYREFARLLEEDTGDEPSPALRALVPASGDA
ncbi:MAG TPA: bacterial transcriptional activator domain-containing protein, partial [Gemmata sp.]|nr:bacterial transcriptional activator domain-containing protein [Gemmata sp.]